MRKAIAQDQYYNLKQGCTKNFLDFLTKFQHLARLGAISIDNQRQDLYYKLNILYQENLVQTLLLHNTFEKLVVQYQHLKYILLSLLACKALDCTNQQVSLTYLPTCTTTTIPRPSILTSIALTLLQTMLTPPTQQPLTSQEVTLALQLLVTTYFNYSKPRHRSLACLEPCNPNSLYKIKEQDQDLEITNLINKDLGKEDS